MTKSVLIVDDEALARKRIRKYFENTHPDWSLREAADGIEALELIAESKPDVMFLDIEMPELNGFDVLRQLPDRSFAVIFQTAYDQFAVKAFDENACDYLLKPYTDERITQALDKAQSFHASVLDKIDDALEKAGRHLDKFAVNVGNRTKVLTADEIVYFLSESHITRIFIAGIDYAYDQSLTYLEKNLDPSLFVRLHRNSIAKISEIDTIERGQNTKVKLRDGTELPVSRERKKALMKILEP